VDKKRDTAASADSAPARLTPVSAIHADLISLPPPKGKIVAAVYGFRDQTGQYKPSPDSSFSTAVTQGATSILVKAMLDSNWFVPVEREGLQDVLTERRIVRALESQPGGNGNLAGLVPASILLEGGIIAYETNVKTGGAGARFLGVGASEEYRTDQVTINLRAVDIRSGRILVSTSTTKGIYSYKMGADMFRYVSYQHLVEAEVGYTRNEPAQLCVQEAIETALVYLIAEGLNENHWALKNPDDVSSPVIKPYLIAPVIGPGKAEASKVAAEAPKVPKSAVVAAPREPKTIPAASPAPPIATTPPQPAPDAAPSTAQVAAAQGNSAETKPVESTPKMAAAVHAAEEPAQTQKALPAEPDSGTASPAAAIVAIKDAALASGAAARSTREYILQLGVFESTSNVESLRDRLNQHGITAQTELREPSDASHGRQQRITVGPFKTRQEAEAIRRKLAAIGIDPGILVVRR
jgi:curli production assembly/transport component CsgG